MVPVGWSPPRSSGTTGTSKDSPDLWLDEFPKTETDEFALVSTLAREIHPPVYIKAELMRRRESKMCLKTIL